MANKQIKITRQQAADRALKDCTRSVNYELGRGGFNCEAEFADQNHECDCSGACAHFVGLDRECSKIPGGWFETSMIFNDATKTRQMFVKVREPSIGDLIVYPDKGKTQGHVGMVTAMAGAVPSTVAHCTARGGLPNAMINEPFSKWWGPNFTKRGMIYAALLSFVEAPEEDVEKTTVLVEGVKSTGYFDAEAGLNYLTIASIKQILTREGYPYTWDKAKLTLTIHPKNAAGVYSTDSDDDSA